MSAFEPDVLEAIRVARVVSIETSREPGGSPRETLIWVVVDDADRVLVRSVRGPRGRWYRDLQANPVGALLVDGEAIGVRASDASDPERVEACSRALRAKYARSVESLASMLDADSLPTTLELSPA